MAYKLSPEADKDIEKIALYTLEKWGAKQTAIYLSDLHVAFERIEETPHLGREREDILPNVFSLFHQQHTIFYQKNKPTLYILRVLHQSRDVNRAFEE